MWIGAVLLCVALIFRAVLHWLSPPGTWTREDRLKRLARLAGGVLAALFLYAKRGRIGGAVNNLLEAAEEDPDGALPLIVYTLKLMLFGVVSVSIVILLLVVALYLFFVVRAMFTAVKSCFPGKKSEDREKLTKQLGQASKRLIAIIRSPIMASAITWGLVVLFVVLPFLVGYQAEKQTVTEAWKTGVVQLVTFGKDDLPEEDNPGAGNSDENNPKGDNFYRAVVRYALYAIIVLGVAFSTYKLLYSILTHALAENRSRDIMDEYAGAIGVLGVGIAILWTIQDESVFKTPEELPAKLLQSFVTVTLVMALVVLTLEVISLLMDMGNRLIREEAGLLFVSFVGEAVLLILCALDYIYKGLSGAMGRAEDHLLDDVQEAIRQLVVVYMSDYLEEPKKLKVTFRAFEEIVIRGEDEEEEP